MSQSPERVFFEGLLSFVCSFLNGNCPVVRGVGDKVFVAEKTEEAVGGAGKLECRIILSNDMCGSDLTDRISNWLGMIGGEIKRALINYLRSTPRSGSSFSIVEEAIEKSGCIVVVDGAGKKWSITITAGSKGHCPINVTLSGTHHSAHSSSKLKLVG